MGNTSSQQVRELFEKIDSGHSGVLKLDDLLTVQSLPGVNHPVTHSPMLLFRFDQARAGSINYEQFQALIQYVRAAQRALLRKKQQETALSPQQPGGLSPGEVRTIDLQQVGDDPSAPVPMLASPQVQGISAQQQALLGAGPPQQSVQVVPSTVTQDASAFDSAVIVEELKAKAREYMSESLKDPATRKEFRVWLFKLADVNERNAVSEAELSLLLKALEYDGISPEALSVSGSALPQSSEESTRRILEEYDTGRTGFLTQ